MTCPNCLRPIANADDQKTWESIGRAEIERPDDWKNDDADHLCWETYGGECEPPEWFATVTPAEVINLRAEVARLTPTWRVDGLAHGMTVLLEDLDGLYYVEVVPDNHEAAGIYISPQPDGLGEPWEGERWCPIVRPS